MNGIIIIATKNYIYGKMAYNLAVTIKATGTKVPVCLIHDTAAIAHLSVENLNLFDQRIETEWDWNKIRFNVDKLSPYDHTLQLDADMLWLYKDPAQLFSQFAEDLTVTNEGYFDIESGEEKLTGNYLWLADRDKTVELYKLKGKLFQMRWEFLMFKKTDKVRKMMKKAEEIRAKPKLETWLFEGQPVDEFAFYVASNIMGLDQSTTPWIPAFWCRPTTNKPPGELDRMGYWSVGFGGTATPPGYREMYDILMANASRKMGLPYTFKLQSKRTHILERRKN